MNDTQIDMWTTRLFFFLGGVLVNIMFGSLWWFCSFLLPYASFPCTLSSQEITKELFLRLSRKKSRAFWLFCWRQMCWVDDKYVNGCVSMCWVGVLMYWTLKLLNCQVTLILEHILRLPLYTCILRSLCGAIAWKCCVALNVFLSL